MTYVDLSIPLDLEGPQANLYGLARASRNPVSNASFTGSVAAGGSCNVDVLQVNPHCNGTHTECVGHITAEPVSLYDVWTPRPLRARVITLTGQPSDGAEHSRPAIPSGTPVLTANELAQALGGSAEDVAQSGLEALIVRTHTGPREALLRTYDANDVLFFTVEAAAFLRAAGVAHLLVDLPSLDRLFDDGEMAAHRAYWGMAMGATTPDRNAPGPDPLRQTITEFIHVPVFLDDGWGTLDLQIAPFVADAAPSRPVFSPDP